MKKKLLIITLIILLALIIVPTIAYFSLKNKNLQKWASDRIESSTGIAIVVDNYDLSFPARVQVHNLSLKTPEGVQVQAKSVNIHLSMLKLITGSVFLKSVIIDGADITVPLDTINKQPKTEQGRKHAAGAAETKPEPLPLGRLEITNATFHIIRKGEETKISGINISLDPGNGFRLSMSPGDPGNSLKVTGTFSNGKELEQLTGSLSISQIRPLLKLLPKGSVPLEKLTGQSKFTLKKKGDGFDFHGNFDFPAVTVKMDGKPLSYPMKGEINGQATMDGSELTLTNSSLTVRSSTFKFQGIVEPEPSIHFTGDQLNLQALTELIPPSQSPFPEGTRFEGTANLSGTGGADGVSADLLLSKDRITVSGMPPLELAGKLRVTEKQIRIISLLLNNPRTDVTISGTIDQYLSDHGTSNLKIRGKMLDFAPKTEKTDKNRAKSAENNEKSEKTTKNKPILLTYPDFEGMTHNLDCEIGSIFLPGLTVSSLKAKLIAGDKGTFLKQFSGTTMDGSFSAKGKLLPEGKGIRFSAKGQAKKLKLTAVLSEKLPVEGGRLSASFNLSGKGADSEALKKAANGTLKFDITDAILRDTPALEKVEEVTGMKFIGKKIDRFNGEAKVRDGKAEIQNTRITAAGIRADLSGTVSLDGDLNLKVPIQLSGESGKKLPAKLRLLESNGKVTLPLEIRGKLEKPKVKIDMKGAKKAVRKKLKKKLLNRLFGN